MTLQGALASLASLVWALPSTAPDHALAGQALYDELAVLYDVQPYPGVHDEIRPGTAVAQRGHHLDCPSFKLLCSPTQLHSREPTTHNRSVGGRTLQVRYGDATALSSALEGVALDSPLFTGLLGLDLYVHHARRWELAPELNRLPVRPREGCLGALQRAGANNEVAHRIQRVVTGSLSIVLVWRDPHALTNRHLEATERLAYWLLGDAWEEVGQNTIFSEDVVIGGTDDSGLFLDRLAL